MSGPLLVTGNVFFMGVARMSSQATLIASNSYHAETDSSAVKQVLDQPSNNFSPGQHFNFNAGEVTWHLVAGIYCQPHAQCTTQYCLEWVPFIYK